MANNPQQLATAELLRRDQKEFRSMPKCDPVTGVCQLPEQDSPADSTEPTARPGWGVHYIGDPMCSWCWGISPTVEAVEAFCAAQGIEFTITMGGLRAGGGDPWNDAFKTFLRNEWQQIAQTTGQPFGFTLLEAAHFDYDTEPACRAVATAKLLQTRQQLPNTLPLQFFTAVQQKFYVAGQDPKEVEFYASICADLGLDFAEFSNLFTSAAARQAVQQEFVRCRQWGVRSFPTLLLEHNGTVKLLIEGYNKQDIILSRLEQAINA